MNKILGGLLFLIVAASVYPLALFANLTSATEALAQSNLSQCAQNSSVSRTLEATGQCDLAARIVEDGSSVDPTLVPNTAVALPAPDAPRVIVANPGQPYTLTPDDQTGDIVALPAPALPQTPDVAPAPAQSVPVAPEPVTPVVVDPEPVAPVEPAPQPQPVDPAPAPEPEPTPQPEPEPTTEPDPEPTTEPTPEPTTEPTEESTPEPESEAPAQEESTSTNNDDNGTVTEDLTDTVTDTVDNVGDVLS